MALRTRRPVESILESNPDNQTLDNDFSLIYWNRLTQRPKVVWGYKAPANELVAVCKGVWFRDSLHYAFAVRYSLHVSAVDYQIRNELVLVDVARGNARSVPLEADDVWSVEASPSRNVVAASISYGKSNDVTTKFLIFDAAGNVRQSATLASGGGVPVPAQGVWVNDETLNVVWAPMADERHGFNFLVRADQLNLITGKVIPQDSPDAVRLSSQSGMSSPTPSALRLVTAEVPANGGDPATTSVYLETLASSDQRRSLDRALVAADATGVKIIGDGHDAGFGAIYFSHGVLLFAPIIQRDSDATRALDRERLNAERTGRLMRIRTALLLYASKNGTSPTGIGDLRPLLVGNDCFLKSDRDFRDPATGKIAFVYTFSGGLDPSKPSEQTIPIGYMALPGGRLLLTNKSVTYVEHSLDKAGH